MSRRVKLSESCKSPRTHLALKPSKSKLCVPKILSARGREPHCSTTTSQQRSVFVGSRQSTRLAWTTLPGSPHLNGPPIHPL